MFLCIYIHVNIHTYMYTHMCICVLVYVCLYYLHSTIILKISFDLSHTSYFPSFNLHHPSSMSPDRTYPYRFLSQRLLYCSVSQFAGLLYNVSRSSLFSLSPSPVHSRFQSRLTRISHHPLSDLSVHL